MRFLISMVFVGMLVLSSQAFAARIKGAKAENILINGKVVAQSWDTEDNIHNTRVIYRNTYYGCASAMDRNDSSKLVVVCIDRN